MATNLALDPALIERARKLSGEKTKKAAVTKALEEFIARREQKELLELFGSFDWDPDYDYKAERFGALPFLVPDRRDHVEAADLHNQCRKQGLQVATIDALLAQLCIRHDLVMLTTDKDFAAIAETHPLRLRI